MFRLQLCLLSPPAVQWEGSHQLRCAGGKACEDSETLANSLAQGHTAARSRAGLPRGLPGNLELPGCSMAPRFSCCQGNVCLFACFSLSYFNSSNNKLKVQAEIENKIV